MRILAIETSCDDTGIAVLEVLSNGQQKLLANLVSSQIEIHAPWGGVVPTLAKREHQRHLTPLLKQALLKSKLLKINNRQSKINDKNLESILDRETELAKQLIPFLQKYQQPDIDYIAVTIGPGLEPALWVGVNFARALSSLWNIPIIPINHIEGHIAAAFFHASRDQAKPSPTLALIVSGGHTQLIIIKKFGQYEIIGETRDDAAGEAFDKVAKMLNLGYPGGPIIAKLATHHPNSIITLPRPMLHSPDFDFSFSGLKTAALYLIKKLTPAQIKKLTPAIAAEFQQAVIDVLIAKTIKAARQYKVKTILLGGGVAANEALRQTLRATCDHAKHDKIKILLPSKKMCADNAAIIAFAAAEKFSQTKKPKTAAWRKLRAEANLRV